jgi:hypothetical protein
MAVLCWLRGFKSFTTVELRCKGLVMPLTEKSEMRTRMSLLMAAWPAKWTPIALSRPDDIELRHDAGGVTLSVRAHYFAWAWELSADEDHYQNSTEGYARKGAAETPDAAVAALKAALHEYATRLLDLAT